MITQDEIKSLHCGLIVATYDQLKYNMHEVLPIIDTIPLSIEKKKYEYLYDVKVHMLMPNQYPCVPNWHRDFVPRDENNKLLEDKIDSSKRMFLWISGPPFTEFEDFVVPPHTWVEFTQNDWHRGTISEEHQWRLFIRATPASLVPSKVLELPILRRHSQVYLDANNFTW